MGTIEETDVKAICDLNLDLAIGIDSEFNIDRKYAKLRADGAIRLGIVVVSTPDNHAY